REILTAEQAAAIPAAKIANFFAGHLGARLLAGREVLRELPFTLALPAMELYSNEGAIGTVGVKEPLPSVPGIQHDGNGRELEYPQDGVKPDQLPHVSKLHYDLTGSNGEVVILQGVVDCLVDEGDGWLLVDYKTDRIAPGQLEEAVNRYRGQLNLYARAVESILGRKVKEKYIYLFHPGLAISL
ncbi:MAG: PD-(D/E)XK nuclease family protein, partial [Desulfotomaculaceae bacterium]|nr:PD-(D/E)XK nuclease family protein [Desulfotomaculaceae bacterium]